MEATEALITYAYTFEDQKMMGHLFTTWSRKLDEIIEFPAMIAGLERLYYVESARLNRAGSQTTLP